MFEMVEFFHFQIRVFAAGVGHSRNISAAAVIDATAHQTFEFLAEIVTKRKSHFLH